MKNNILKSVTISLIMISFITATYGQQIQENLSKTVDIAPIPVIVSQNFVNEYSDVPNAKWTAYSEEFLGKDWYDYNLLMNSTEPFQYYVVDFIKNDSPLKAIYAKSGKKIAVEQIISSKLPITILYAIQNADYSGWKMMNDKVVMYQNAPTDVTRVYKIRVEKGLLQHDLLYSSAGALLIDNEIKKY